MNYDFLFGSSNFGLQLFIFGDEMQTAYRSKRFLGKGSSERQLSVLPRFMASFYVVQIAILGGKISFLSLGMSFRITNQMLRNRPIAFDVSLTIWMRSTFK